MLLTAEVQPLLCAWTAGCQQCEHPSISADWRDDPVGLCSPGSQGWQFSHDMHLTWERPEQSSTGGLTPVPRSAGSWESWWGKEQLLVMFWKMGKGSACGLLLLSFLLLS